MSVQQSLWQYVAPPDLLRGRTVLVTGASRGIGRAVARAIAAVGAQTILLARDSSALESLADEIVSADNLEPGLIPADLEGANIANYDEIASLIESRYAGLDGLVLNAGILGEMAPLATYDPVAWARVFQVNVHSQFLLLQATLPLLQRSAQGSIIFTASGVGRVARAYWGAYAATKFATEGIMQTLAAESDGSSLRVNAINPGRTRTQMRASAYPAEDSATLPEPNEITPAYLYLLGRDGGSAHGLSLDAQPPK